MINPVSWDETAEYNAVANPELQATVDERLAINRKIIDLGCVTPSEQAPLLAEYKLVAKLARQHRSRY